MKGLAAHTIWTRERLLAILRESDRPMSTPELDRAMAEGGHNCISYLAIDRECHRGWGRTRLGRCDAGCWHGPVYANLRALASLDVIEWIPTQVRGRYACAWWRLAEHDQSDAYFNRVLGEA